jgi:MFS family permease
MVTVFFLGFAISPLWTATMDIAPDYAGTSSSLMNASGAVAGIVSPVAFAWILDRTGSWTTPFAFSVGLLLFAIVMTYWIRPRPPDRGRPQPRQVGGGGGIGPPGGHLEDRNILRVQGVSSSAPRDTIRRQLEYEIHF